MEFVCLNVVCISEFFFSFILPSFTTTLEVYETVISINNNNNSMNK